MVDDREIDPEYEDTDGDEGVLVQPRSRPGRPRKK